MRGCVLGEDGGIGDFQHALSRVMTVANANFSIPPAAAVSAMMMLLLLHDVCQ